MIRVTLSIISAPLIGMIKMDLNVLKDFPYRPRYYILRPWKWFRECWINLKNAWRRATKGYAAVDLWNMDDWLLSVLPDMLRELADRHSAYPGVEPFETDEKWEAWLRDMAAKLEQLREDPDENDNEYAQEYYAALEQRRTIKDSKYGMIVTYTGDNEFKQLREKYLARHQELYNRRAALAKEVGCELFSYLRYLWD